MKPVVWLLVVLPLSACTSLSPSGSLSADDRAELYWEHFSDRPVPRAVTMDQYLVDLTPWNDTATLALYADPEAPGMARVCVTATGVDDCGPPVDETRRLVGEVDGYQLFLFSGPGDVGFDSELAPRSAGASWSVVTAP